MTTSPAVAPPRSAGRLLLWLGLALAVLGILGYVVQLSLHRLWAPWYMPALGTLGVVLLVVALGRRRTVWRVLALVLVVLIAGVEWLALLGEPLPAYTGPVAAGKPFPEFATLRADGTSFTRADLEGGPDSVLVFFRGRW